MDKLVRDRIKMFSEQANDGRVFYKASQKDLPTFLGRKIVEEAQEVAEELVQPVPDLNKIIEELADLREVEVAIKKYYSISDEAIEHTRMTKALRKGTFEEHLVLKMDTNLPRFQK